MEILKSGAGRISEKPIFILEGKELVNTCSPARRDVKKPIHAQGGRHNTRSAERRVYGTNRLHEEHCRHAPELLPFFRDQRRNVIAPTTGKTLAMPIPHPPASDTSRNLLKNSAG